MSTSGTFSFNPSGGEIVLYAYGLCGLRRPSLTNEHMADARMAVNMLQSEHANEQPNLWTVDLQSINLIEGVSTYQLGSDTIAILDGYLRQNAGTSSQNDTYMLPISRTEYASFPNKTQEARPTVYWFDRLIAPSVTVWQPPDNNGPYQFQFYRVRQMQDVTLPSGTGLDIPYRFLAAFAFGLAEYLAWSHAPDKVEGLALKAKLLWDKAMAQDREDAGLYIAPMLNSYYRR